MSEWRWIDVFARQLRACAVSLGEVSFTEWAVQYWPVKLTIPIGAALMVLQGISKLIKDIMILTSGRT